MSDLDFTAKWGEAFDVTVTVTDDGDPFDLTSYTVKWVLAGTEKTSGGGVNVTDATNGEVVLTVTTSDTETNPGRYDHELRIFDGSDHIITVMEGVMTVTDSEFR